MDIQDDISYYSLDSVILKTNFITAGPLLRSYYGNYFIIVRQQLFIHIFCYNAVSCKAAN